MTSSVEAKSYYEKALLQGRKKGGAPLVLEHLLEADGIKARTECPLGIVNIALNQIAGTVSEGRSNCFSKDFYPLLSAESEFGSKWISLCQSHLDEGIHDPIKVYEYMNRYYVLEGNKRVSVLKYFASDEVPASVIRIMPPLLDRPDIRLYYEYVDFYRLSSIPYIYFEQEGHFARLQRLVGKKCDEPWSDDDRMDFKSCFSRFSIELEKLMGELDYVQVSEAFLYFISLYDYGSLLDIREKELRKQISKCKEAFLMLQKGSPSKLLMEPSSKKKNPILDRMPKLPVQPILAGHMKVAFIHNKSAETSPWIYNHEMGRHQLEKNLSSRIETMVYNDIDIDTIEDTLEDAIKKSNQIIFATSPIFLKACLKAATDHPEVKILNCSIRKVNQNVRTYYARMYEIKYIMGAIAGAMTESDQIAYIADYPILGTFASINAYALGAKMVNPRVKVHLVWSKTQQGFRYEDLLAKKVDTICDKDNLSLGEYDQHFGLYHIEKDHIWNMALPLWNWSVFYTKTIENVLNGTWKSEIDKNSMEGINYWWGISSGIVDLIHSNRLPIGTIRLIDLLKKTIGQADFNPFSGILFSQKGVVQSRMEDSLCPEEIITMDWLAENVIGDIPVLEDLTEETQNVVRYQGIHQEEYEI